MILILILIIFLAVYNNTFYKNSRMDKTEFKEIKNENKKMKINKIIKIIFIILSILLVVSIIATILYGALFLGMSFITLFGVAYIDKGTDSSPYINLGNTTNFFVNSSIFLINAWICSLIIKIVINQITLMKRLQKNKQLANNITDSDSKNTLKTSIRKMVVVLIIIAIITALIVFTANILESNKNLKDVLDDPPSYEMYDKTSYYFIYNNKIYYYGFNYKNDFEDYLYSMNLDGTENKIIAKTDELRYADFYFVYNNEAYYYTLYYNVNKKINLETGKITDLENNDIYLSKTFKNGIVYTFFDNAVAGNAYSKFKKININTNQTIFEIKTKYSMAGNQYYLDYDGNNIYYLEDYYSDYPSIFKNNEIIYQFTDYNRYNFSDIEFIAVNNEYIYFKQNNYIYKLNVGTKTIEKQLSCNIGDIKRISSGNNSDNYFYSNNKIYSFDFDNDKFDMILDNIKNMPEYVYNTNNKLIFTENTDNLKYYTEKNNLGSAIIYNVKSGEIQAYNNIRKFCYDEDFLYMMIDVGNKYYVEKIPYNN